MKLTRRDQYQAAIHEAGHAVIYALAGVSVGFVAVAPSNVRRWEFVDPEGNAFNHFVGICGKASNPMARDYMTWSEEKSCFDTDVDTYLHILEVFSELCQQPSVRHDFDHEVMAHIVGVLAGYAAEARYVDGDVPVDSFPSKTCDISIAMGLCAFLPGENNMENLSMVLGRTLANQEVWRYVTRLADALVEQGCITDIKPYLPEQEPHWPDYLI